MKKEKKEKKELSNDMIAKKDHTIFKNDFKLVIKEGDILKDIPSEFIATLKTEKVI